MMGLKRESWLRRRMNRIAVAFNGWRELLKTEVNARIHLAAMVVVLLMGYLLNIAANDWRWISSAIALVWLTELINTALEELCDIIQPAHDNRIKRIKDMAAGAVLIASFYALMVGIMVFYPMLKALFAA